MQFFSSFFLEPLLVVELVEDLEYFVADVVDLAPGVLDVVVE